MAVVPTMVTAPVSAMMTAPVSTPVPVAVMVIPMASADDMLRLVAFQRSLNLEVFNSQA